MLGTILLIIVSPLIVWFAYWYYTVQYYERYLKNIPGPRGLPLIGNSLDIASTTTILPTLISYYNKYKRSFKVYIGSQPYYFATDVKDLEFILSSTTILTKSAIYKFISKWLGIGLLTSTGNRWRKHRKIITPAFHFQILEDFIEVFNSQSEILVSKLKEESKPASVDLYPLIARCTLDIICETAMGTTVNAQNDLDSEYVKCVKMLLQVITERTFSPLLANDMLYIFSDTYRREKYALKIVHDYTRSVIKRRKAEFFGDSKNYESSVDSLGRKKKRAFLDLLLEYSTRDPSFTEEDIRQEVDTFMFEGHDTTATSITFALYALAIYPDIQEKVFAEIENIFSDDPKRNANYRDLQEMKYLEMVIKESLRVYPTVAQIGRALEEDVDWNGVLLPKGLMIYIFLYGVHQSSEWYENPEKFDPERFNAENSKNRNPFTYIPFSAGVRNCIGQKFAMLEMKSAISHILRNFELLPASPEHKILFEYDGILKSTSGVRIQLKKRY
uniref:Cytochromes P450 family 4 n=1 Tax=Holotrichia parallela TaxID=93412 RepID=A0A6M3GYH9_HOLPA|nr:cytochromes P450 family 4 [Holotrichia parallela]